MELASLFYQFDKKKQFKILLQGSGCPYCLLAILGMVISAHGLLFYGIYYLVFNIALSLVVILVAMLTKARWILGIFSSGIAYRTVCALSGWMLLSTRLYYWRAWSADSAGKVNQSLESGLSAENFAVGMWVCINYNFKVVYRRAGRISEVRPIYLRCHPEQSTCDLKRVLLIQEEARKTSV